MTAEQTPIKTSQQRARDIYIEMRKNLRHMGQTIKLLMRHPDATQEQLIQTHIAYSQLFTSYHATRALLRAKWPETKSGSTRPWPWNDDTLEDV